MKKKLGITLGLVLMLCLGVLAPKTVHAADNPTLKNTSFYLGAIGSDCINVMQYFKGDLSEDYYVTSIKSSKPQVIKFKKYGSYLYLGKAKKCGTTSITVKIKSFDDENIQYTAKAKFTVKKSPIVFKSVTVNGKNVYKKRASSCDLSGFKKGKKVKINVALKKGWRIKAKHSVTNITTSDGAVKFKLNKKIKLKKDYTWFNFALENKKGETYSYSICLHK